MARIRLALIGAGRRGRGAHLPVIARMTDRFELVAVGDVDPEAARVAEQYGARPYASVGEIISNAVREYCNDVRNGGFPSDAESYHTPQMAKGRKTIFIES